jgi:hypothetical protein
MKKLLKNKERRDTLLLIAMAIICILFLVYLFVPLGRDGQNPVDGDAVPDNDKVSKRIELSDNHQTDPDGFTEFSNRIEKELNHVLVFLKESPRPFQDYPIEGLKKILFPPNSLAVVSNELAALYQVIQKAYRINFYDLKDMFDFEFPPGVNNYFIFNLYTGLFMVKLREEGVLREIDEFPDTMFKRIVNCCSYVRIKNEIEKDYQSMPVLFYFYLLIQRLDIFPNDDVTAFLKERIGDIRDLSPGKFIDRINSILSFSRDPRTFRISWKEEDDLNPDDHRSYVNVKISTINFLGQSYLVFPDYHHGENNKWIRDLQESDSGNIELVDFQLSDEDPVKNVQVRFIFYAPGTSRFIVLLVGNDFSEKTGLPARLVRNRIEDVRQYYLSVNFASRFNDSEAFKAELLNFGHFIKKQISIK